MLKSLNTKLDELRRSHNVTLDYSWQCDIRGFTTHGSDSSYDTSLESLIDQAQTLINSQLNRLGGYLATDKSSK